VNLKSKQAHKTVAVVNNAARCEKTSNFLYYPYKLVTVGTHKTAQRYSIVRKLESGFYYIFAANRLHKKGS
jgi:hypothetical protein